MSKTTMHEWLHPDATTLYEKNRHCSRGVRCVTYEQLALSGQRPEVGRVSRYVEPTGDFLLCSACDRRRVAEDQEVHEFIGTGVRKYGHRVSYALPALREHRLEQDLSKEDLARMATCAAETIRKVEAGKSNASTKLAARLARALGVEVPALRKEG